MGRMIANLLHKLGIIPEPLLKEVQRTDLVGQYVGSTGPKTKEAIQEAKNGNHNPTALYSALSTPTPPHCRDPLRG